MSSINTNKMMQMCYILTNNSNQCLLHDKPYVNIFEICLTLRNTYDGKSLRALSVLGNWHTINYSYLDVFLQEVISNSSHIRVIACLSEIIRAKNRNM